MTERKPSGVSWASWVERQIEEGRRDGLFDGLDGHGRPLDDLDRPHDEMWWVKAKLAREEVVVTPPSIAIRMERDAVLAAAMEARSEDEVRSSIHALNERIRELNRGVSWGPPTSVAPLDVDQIVQRWRARRPDDPTPPPVASTTDAAAPDRPPAHRRRPTWLGWLRRRRARGRRSTG